MENEIVTPEEELNELPEGDEVDWEAEAKKAHGIAKRYRTKLEKAKTAVAPQGNPPKEPVSNPIKNEKEGFDYGELAYLTAKNVPEEDHDWLSEGKRTTGKELKDLLKSEWVQKELRERQTARMADSAVPTGTKRSQGGTFTEDTVEYWVAADKQPPESKPLAFRKKVLDARQKQVTDDSKFSKNSIVAPGYSL